MPVLSKKSKERLSTCHPKLIKVMERVIKRTDYTVLFGHRPEAEQFELFKKGRKLFNGKWVKVGKTVTDRDGKTKKSEHNYLPSHAIDIAPYPIDWNNLDRFEALKDIVFEEAAVEGIKLVWGADWDGDGNIAEHSLQDYPHFELHISEL